MYIEHTRYFAVLICAAAVVSCAGESSRYGELRFDDTAASFAHEGVTAIGRAAQTCEQERALIGDGDYRVRLHGTLANRLQIVAESSDGPIVLRVRCGDVAICNDDSGAGHRPIASLAEAGRDAACVIQVAPMRGTTALRYRLRIQRVQQSEAREEVAVTITSNPSGLSVANESGENLGTTPLMFALQNAGEEVVFQVTSGESKQVVRGVPRSGALALHADLTAVVPTQVTQVTQDASVVVDASEPVAASEHTHSSRHRDSNDSIVRVIRPRSRRPLPFTCADGRVVQTARECWVRCLDGTMAPAQQYCMPGATANVPVPPGSRNNRRNGP